MPANPSRAFRPPTSWSATASASSSAVTSGVAIPASDVLAENGVLMVTPTATARISPIAA
jgi:ABC-type branched-subunit amino acid transport system substrate-binding protein